MSDIVYEAVSLGESCETKFHIARKLNAQGHPGRSDLAFRLELALPARGERIYGWDLFDWQGMTLSAVCEYLERDFEAVFERADLHVVDGLVMHRELGVDHTHNFQGDDDLDFRVDRLYPQERIKFQQRAQAFRRRLESPGPVLYIHQATAFPTLNETRRLITALSSRSPEHRFHLLLMAFVEHDQDLSALNGLVTKAPRGSGEIKPKGREWEGNDAAWDAALAPFMICPPTKLARLSAAGSEAGADRRWTPLVASWRSLIAGQPLDMPTPPLTGSVPVRAWDYGVVSEPIRPDEASIVRLSMTVTEGCVGASIVAQTGDRLLTEEMPVTPADGRVEILLPLPSGSDHAMILLRNFDSEGQAGSFQVHEVMTAPRGALTPAEMLRTLSEVHAA